MHATLGQLKFLTGNLSWVALNVDNTLVAPGKELSRPKMAIFVSQEGDRVASVNSVDHSFHFGGLFQQAWLADHKRRKFRDLPTRVISKPVNFPIACPKNGVISTALNLHNFWLFSFDVGNRDRATGFDFKECIGDILLIKFTILCHFLLDRQLATFNCVVLDFVG